MNSLHVLVVHNDSAIRQLVLDSLAQDGVRVSQAGGGREALLRLDGERVHVLVAALDKNGAAYELVRQVATVHPLLGVVFLVDETFAGNAPELTQGGRIQYLATPLTKESVRCAIQRAQGRQVPPGQTGTSSAIANGSAESPAPEGSIIAASKAMREILDLVRRCAPTDAPVLISGEPDTGKQMIAREIHRRSGRASNAFVRVSCGSIRESELADRLFARGERGPDPGNEASCALLRKAQGGTLFLENVSQLPAWSQTTLLDVLQGSRRPGAGTNGSGAADVRVIASTTADLRGALAQRSFLSSLYYYLNVVQIHVPPLRHRSHDIRPLAEMYLATANAMRARQGGNRPCRFSEDALQCLSEYDWPGNNLQLASVVAHAVLLADQEEIGRTTLREPLGETVARGDSDNISVPLFGGLKEIERAVIEAVVQRCRGNKAAAARALRLDRRTLYRILQGDRSGKKEAGPAPLVLDSIASDCVPSVYS